MIGGVEYYLSQQPPVHQYVTWCIYRNITECKFRLYHLKTYSCTIDDRIVSMMRCVLGGHIYHGSVRTKTFVGIEDHYRSRHIVSIHTLPVSPHTVGEISILEINDMYI